MPLSDWCVVTVRPVRGLTRGARAQGALESTEISLFMWIPHLMSCGIHMIMDLAAVPLGQPGQNGQGSACGPGPTRNRSP